MFEPRQDAFCYDHGTVDDKSEIDGPEAHEVCRYTEQVHHRKGKQHREGYYRSDDQAGPYVPYQQYKDKYDDNATFHQVGGNCPDGSIYQFRPVEVRMDM